MNAVTAQILVALFLTIIIFVLGFGTVWPSYTLRLLVSEDSPLGAPITQIEANLIASVVMLGSLPPIAFVGYINEKFGRKRSVIIAALGLAISWSLIASAKGVPQIMVGRFLFGVTGGMYMCSSLVFMSEVIHTSIRGTLVSMIGCVFNIGCLFSYAAGWACTYEVVNYFCVIVVVIYIVLACFLKETPEYLLRYGNEKEALNSLKFYRGTTTASQEILEELAEMRRLMMKDNDCEMQVSLLTEKEKLNQESLGAEPVETPINHTKQNPWKIFFKSKSAHRAIILLSIILVCSVLMGMIGVQTYAGQFFMRAAPALSPDLCSVLLAVVLTTSSAMSIVIFDRISRRVLMIASCISSAIFLGLLASMLRWSWAPEWGIPLMIVLFCMCFQLGAVNVPFVQIAECLSAEMKNFGSTCVTATLFLANFTVVFFFEPTVSYFGLDGIFFVFSFFSLLTAALTYLFMRESRNVPLQLIQESYERGYIYRKVK